MKRKRALCCVLTALMILTGAAFGRGGLEAKASPTNPTVVLDGRTLTFDVPAQIINNRTMLPFRGIAEAMGAKVYWDAATQKISMFLGDRYLIMYVSNVNMTYGQYSGDASTETALPYVKYETAVNFTMDTPPMLINNRTLLPVRAVETGLGAVIAWDGNSYTVYITSPSVQTPAPTPTPSPSLTPVVLTGQIYVNYALITAPAPYARSSDGVVMVPLTDMAAKLGVTVEWNAAAQTAKVNTTPPLYIWIGNTNYQFENGTPTAFSPAPEFVSGVVYVPLKFFGEVITGCKSYITDGRIYVEPSGAGNIPTATPSPTPTAGVTADRYAAAGVYTLETSTTSEGATISLTLKEGNTYYAAVNAYYASGSDAVPANTRYTGEVTFVDGAAVFNDRYLGRVSLVYQRAGYIRLTAANMAAVNNRQFDLDGLYRADYHPSQASASVVTGRYYLEGANDNYDAYINVSRGTNGVYSFTGRATYRGENSDDRKDISGNVTFSADGVGVCNISYGQTVTFYYVGEGMMFVEVSDDVSHGKARFTGMYYAD